MSNSPDNCLCSKYDLQEGQFVSDAVNMSCNLSMEPLPGLDSICKELLQEDGYRRIAQDLLV